MKILYIRPVRRGDIFIPGEYSDRARSRARAIYYQIPCMLLHSIKSNDD